MQPPWKHERGNQLIHSFNFTLIQSHSDRSPYLHLVDVGGMVPEATEVIRTLTAAVRNETLVVWFLDPRTVSPV